MATARKGDPAPVPNVPWGTHQNGETPTPPIETPIQEAAMTPEQALAALGIDVEPLAASDMQPPQVTPEQIQSAFGGQPMKQASPFAPKPKAQVEPEPEPLKLSEDDPTWLELVQFCQKHGQIVIQARYPQPRGGCIDTIWRGVTVFAHPTTQVRHKDLGWIDWKVAIYE